ncbi:hypothetical protein [Atlantibacter subterraneus]|uniref:hypothetical protein n=1 Tax=Atlantibacter subterraneus TaxID=255519 RepID=UPI002FDD9B1F
MEFSRRGLLAFGGAGLVGAAASSAFSHMQVIEPKEWIVGDHGGDYGPEKDISDAFNKTIKAKGSRSGRVIVPYVNGLLLVGKESLLIPDNTEIDFCDNVIKLQNGASKYLLANQKTSDVISGRVVIRNATFDGNKRGGQARRYDRVTKDKVWGDIYDYKDNYPGFCLMFDRIKELIVDNVKIVDPESWGIAHFLYDTASFSNISIISQSGIGLNGDGITGVATRDILIMNLHGYTNDDMIGISASRATVQEYSIFNPGQGRDVESVTVRNLRSEQQNQTWSMVGIGLYFSDDKTIRNIDIAGVEGCFLKHIIRLGNYWAMSSATGIDNLEITHLHATTIYPGSADVYLFSGNVNQLSVIKSKISRLLTTSPGYYNGGENAVLYLENGTVGNVWFDNFIYQSEFLSVDNALYNTLVVCGVNGQVDRISFDIHIISDKSNNYQLLKKDQASEDFTTLDIVSCLSNSDIMTYSNMTNSQKVVPGNVFNVKICESLGGESTINRAGGDVWIDGTVDVAGDVLSIPHWCTPRQPKITRCYNRDALQQRYVARIDTQGAIAILQKPRRVKKIIFDGAGWKCI